MRTSPKWKELWKNECLHTVAAFYNTAGGIMTVGRKDDGTLVGVASTKKTLKSISDTITNKLHIKADVRLVVIDGKNCIRIIVPKGNAMIDCDGVFYIRVGNTTQTVSGTELKSMLMKEAGREWLDRTCDLLPESLSFEAITFFVEKGKQSGHIPSTADPKDAVSILNRFDLIVESKLTLSAALLFSERPLSMDRGAFLKIGQFDKDRHIIRDEFVEGPLIKIPDKTVRILLDKYVPPRYAMDENSISRIRVFDYPETALRELIVNALVHKDYAYHEPVTVSVFPDRVEIFNMGLLPPSMRIEDLKRAHSSIRRNEKLSEVFFAAGLVENWAMGIDRVMEACRTNGNPEPEFSIMTGGIKATLYTVFNNKRFDPVLDTHIDLSKVDTGILKLLFSNPSITALEISSELGISMSTAQRHLASLNRTGVITRQGSKKKGVWIVNPPN